MTYTPFEDLLSDPSKIKTAADLSLLKLSELVSEAHALIQQDFADIDPVIGVNRGMRQNGIPADVITIDCLRSAKRVLLILHDLSPDIVSYQFCLKDQDPGTEFESLAFTELSAQVLYDWVRDYFTGLVN